MAEDSVSHKETVSSSRASPSNINGALILLSSSEGGIIHLTKSCGGSQL